MQQIPLALTVFMLTALPVTSPATTTDGIYQLSEVSHTWEGTVIVDGLLSDKPHYIFL